MGVFAPKLIYSYTLKTLRSFTTVLKRFYKPRWRTLTAVNAGILGYLNVGRRFRVYGSYIYPGPRVCFIGPRKGLFDPHPTINTTSPRKKYHSSLPQPQPPSTIHKPPPPSSPSRVQLCLWTLSPEASKEQSLPSASRSSNFACYHKVSWLTLISQKFFIRHSI